MISTLIIFLAFLQQPIFGDDLPIHMLRNIIIGRCWEYQEIMKDYVKVVDCSEVWEAFHGAVAFKTNCSITEKSYDRFFELTKPRKDFKNKVM